ncbi:unnamed protein product, partial [marine sediment metagenome]
MDKKRVIIIAFFVLVTFLLFGQEETGYQQSGTIFSLKLTPSFEIPIGTDRDIFNYGGGVDLSAVLQPAGQSLVYFSSDLSYSFIPTQKADLSVSRFSLGAGAGLNFGLIGNLSLFANTRAGYYYGFLNDGSGTSQGNPFVSAGLGLAYQFTKRISLGVGASYNSYLGFYNNWSISLGTAFRLSS